MAFCYLTRRPCCVSSFDIDVIDPSLAPATGTPELGTSFPIMRYVTLDDFVNSGVDVARGASDYP